MSLLQVTYLNCVPLDETGIIVKEGVVHTCKNKVKSAEITVGALLQRDYTKFYDCMTVTSRNIKFSATIQHPA